MKLGAKKEEDQLIPADPLAESRGLVRAFIIGAILSLLIAVGESYGTLVVMGPYMTQEVCAPGVFFLFFLLIGPVSIILKLIDRKLGFSRTEIILIYSMMLAASALPSWGLMHYLIPIMGAPLYYATPENKWAELLLPYIPHWMMPDDFSAIRYLYEGLPKGVGVPWLVWVKPLLIWFTLLISFYLVMISIVVILRKQWMDNERLIYPLVRIPLEVVRSEEGRSIVNPFLKNRAMWLGFAVPLVILSINAFHNYTHVVPEVVLTFPKDHPFYIFRNTESIRFRIFFGMIGLAYLINLDIAFSLWFFHLFTKSQQGISNIIGFSSTENLGRYSMSGQSVIVSHQEMGAMIVLVLFGLWVARSHLRDVFRKALRGDSDVDDSEEILSYRAAVLILVGGLAVMGVWLGMTGIPFWVIPVFFFGLLVGFTGLTRIVAEAGVPSVRYPTVPAAFTISALGSENIGPAGLVSFAYTFSWAGDTRNFVMSACANSLKLAEPLRGRRRFLFWGMILAIAISFIGSAWGVIHYASASGGLNVGRHAFGGGARDPFNYAAHCIKNPSGPRWDGWLYKGIGAGFMMLLMLARRRFLWWPLHPLGYPISGVWPMQQLWFSTFLAWLIKATVLKYGGPKVFRQTRPFFLGMVFGEFFTYGLWITIDSFTGMSGNFIGSLG